MKLVKGTVPIGQTHGRKLRMLKGVKLREMCHLGIKTTAAERPEVAIARSDTDNVVR